MRELTSGSVFFETIKLEVSISRIKLHTSSSIPLFYFYLRQEPKAYTDKDIMIKPVMTKEYESMFNVLQQIQVPTKTVSPDSTNDQQRKEIDIRQLNVDDLKLLKTQDPFLYYSIPAVNKAKLTSKTVDYNQVLQDAVQYPSTNALVSRRSRVSTECHAALTFEEL